MEDSRKDFALERIFTWLGGRICRDGGLSS